MKYYRVKPEFDNVQQLKRKRHYMLKPGIWIGNELYTACELNRLENKGVIINNEIFDIVEIKKTETYFFFGARFANDTGATVPF